MAEYIERESLAADGWYLQRHINGDGYDCVESMNILDIPAADVVEVRKAHWMKDEQNKWRCSDCGKGDNYAYSWDSETKDWTNLQDLYCPNCGAKMTEV